MDEELSHEVFRMAREALTSIIRHAGAHSVRIGLLYEQAFVTLLVQDDGQGFDPTAAGEKAELLGLRALSERARSLGATVQVDSLAGWGTRIRARFPYRPPDEPDAGRLRVLIAAGRPVLRAGMARLLSGTEPGIVVVGEAATAREALDACDALKPDVILADLGLSARGTAGTADPGESAADLLLRHHQGLAVVGLCEAGDERLVASAMRAGARGCVDMGADGPELARAIIAAGGGQAILSGAVLRQLHRGLRDEEPGAALTEREQQVRSLMEQGLPDKVIAEQLVLSVKTVEKHAGAVLRKTGARNRTELAAQAGSARLRKAASRDGHGAAR
jgi:DNA-binding NarL/FixJ family response regulator